MAELFSWIIHQYHSNKSSVKLALKSRLVGALIWAILFSFLPWTSPTWTPAVEQAFEHTPASVQWAAPLALSITGWTEQALSVLSPVEVAAAPPTTMTIAYNPVVSACMWNDLVVTLVDSTNQPVPSWPITLTSSGVGMVVPAATNTDANGQAVVQFGSVVTGSAVVTISAVGGPVQSVNITVTNGAPEKMTLVAATNVISSGDSVELTVQVMDCYDNPVPNVYIYDGVDPTSVGYGWVGPLAGWTDDSGSYTFVFTGTRMGPASIVAAPLDARYAALGKSVEVMVEPNEPTTMTLTATPGWILPQGRSSDLEVYVEDWYGNPVSGCYAVVERLSGPAVTFDPASRMDTTNVSGTASVALLSTDVEGDVTVRAFICNGLDMTTTVHIEWVKVYVPVIVRHYPTGDLQVTSIVTNHVGQDKQGHDLYEVLVTIRNNGRDVINNGFWVDLYLDPAEPVGLNVLWHEVSPRGKTWYIQRPFAPGTTITLSTNDPDVLDGGHVESGRYSYWPGDLGSNDIMHELWAMVDCFGPAPQGGIFEPDEDNNIFGPFYIR